MNHIVLDILLSAASLVLGSRLGYFLARRGTIAAVSQGLLDASAPLVAASTQRATLATAPVAVGSSPVDPNYGQVTLLAWQVCGLMGHVPGGANCARCGL